MKKPTIISFLILLVLGFTALSASAQLSPAQAGYLDAVVDFGADPTGSTVTTAQLQNAINTAIAQVKPLFIPAGTYLIDNSLIVENDVADREAQNVFIAGSSVNPGQRTVILLKAGSFPDPANKKVVLQHNGWGNEDYPNTFNRILQSVDIKIQANNAGAIGLRWRGAEGCGLFDVNIDITGGFAGIDGLVGSGGSAAGLSIKGGEYGLYFANSSVQPSPTLTNVTFENQNIAAIYAVSTRGPVTITGGKFVMKEKVPVFSLARSRGWNQDYVFAPGGNALLTDCQIEYTTQNADNQVTIFPEANRDNSVFFDNVYVKNATRIVNHDNTLVPSNATGWRKYKKFAYSSGVYQNTGPNIGQDESIYLDGSEVSGRTVAIYDDNQNPPSNLQARHSWGSSFPGFETPGAVNVKNYEGLVDNGDWSPAFNAAIAAAAAGSNVVFVPKGEYPIFNTINMQSQTALIGAGHHHSVILGRDIAGRRFGGSTNSWTDPKPMVQTPDDKTATCILGDIAIRVNGPYNGTSHTAEALACYAILWRAGNNSVIRNIDYMHQQITGTNYRAAYVVKNSLGQASWLNLRSIASPSTISGFTFTSECKVSYHTSTDIVPSRILLETVNGTKRLMTRSLPPSRYNASASQNSFTIPNLTVAKSDGSAFNISSLKITNAAWVADEGTDVTIQGVGGNGSSVVVPLRGIDRNALQTVTLNWTGVTKIIITSEVPFSIDDVSVNGANIDFESLSGDVIAEKVDWQNWCSGYAYMYLPIYYMAHAYVSIEGGCKYYNHWKHGVTWMRITEPYVYIDNDPGDIVSIYHAHAQHSQNFHKFKLVDAHNVSIYGAKTENALEFAFAENSSNVRFTGHGGMTNPPVGTAHYRIENSTDYLVSSPTDEVNTSSSCPCYLGDAMLPHTAFGTYDDIQEVVNGNVVTPDKKDSPILYMRGNPNDPWGLTCTTPRTLTVVNGTGSGTKCAGEPISVTAATLPCKNFAGWTGDIQHLENPALETAVGTMPDANITLTASYTDKPVYTVTVTTGSASPTSGCEGTEVSINANAAPTGKVFDKWVGDTAAVSDITKPSATLTIPASNVAVQATYRDYSQYYNGAPFAVPGIINLEEYDNGDEGIAYHDADPTNGWTVFRTDEGVDINEITVGGADYFIGNIAAGEWINYSINIQNAGTYNLVVSHASGATGGTFHLEIDGVQVGNSVTTSGTGGWKTFQEKTVNGYALTAGEHVLTVYMESAGFNLKTIELVATGTPSYTLTVGSGSGDGSYAQGTIVVITADTPPAGQTFDKWTGDVVNVADADSTTTTITMPAANISVSATYKAIPTYTLTVESGSGDGSYAQGTIVPITADAPSAGQIFYKWTGDVVNVADVDNSTTTLTMPAANVSISATYKQPVTGVSVSPKSASLAPGTTLQLTATVLPSNATNKTVSWSSTSPTVATVNASGLVTALAAGTATITVITQESGYTDSCQITIQTTGDFTTLAPIADSYVAYGSDASKNFGTNIYLRYRNAGPTSNFTYNNYLKFDLSGISGTVMSAKLRLYCSRADNSSPANIYLVNDDSWTESGITANNQPTNIGAAIAPEWNPYGKNGQYIEISLNPAMVQAQADGDNLLSMKSYSTNNVIVMYHSKENTANKPQLVVETIGGQKRTVSEVVNAPDESGLLVYPNPLSGNLLTIKGKAIENATIAIVDVTGKTVHLQKNENSHDVELLLNTPKKGIYFIVVTNAKQTITQKLIVR